MQAQLARIEEELQRAEERLRQLARGLTLEQWLHAPGPGCWTAAACVEHLNLTAEAMLPRLREGLEKARLLGGPAPRRYSMGLMGWMIWKGSGPKARPRIKTIAAFDPLTVPAPAELLERFRLLQDAQTACLRDADGLPLDRVRMTSPFKESMSYNLYAGFRLLPAHQHRHLSQAEEALASW